MPEFGTADVEQYPVAEEQDPVAMPYGHNPQLKRCTEELMKLLTPIPGLPQKQAPSDNSGTP